mmetsp:Transcript_9169/g.27600  ORF Transcript_9169/g.27600 Transcript_9169/m.27600 type:complete len:560 (+) Transcript_9169:92-1771(+)
MENVGESRRGSTDFGRVFSLNRLLSGTRSGENGFEGAQHARFGSRRGFSIRHTSPPARQQQFKDDTALEKKHRRRKAPGNSQGLALLQRMVPVGRTKVLVRRRVKGLFTNWVTYIGEIRGCFGLFFPISQVNGFSSDSLEELVALVSFRGCDVETTRSSPRGDGLKLKNGIHRFVIGFEDKEALGLWKSEIMKVSRQRRMNISDFKIISPIGNGAGGKVFLVHRHSSGQKYAMKVVEKDAAVYVDSFHFQHAVDERILLELVSGHPFCIQMKYAFQTRKRLYYVMEFCEGGDIFGYMWGQRKSVGEVRAKLVAAQVLLALEKIHAVGFIYRDLKPENILIDAHGFVKVADFGLCKRLPGNVRDGRTSTICGTFSYLAPEMLSGRYSASVDIWTFGIFLFQMITGRTPCDARSVEDARRFFRRGCPITFDPENMSEEVISLLKELMHPEVNDRLGCGHLGLLELKSHEYFSDVNWDQLARKSINEDVLDVTYINRVVHESQDEVQAVRNFDLDDLKFVHFGDDNVSSIYGDWEVFPLLNWLDDGGDLDPHYLMGFDYSCD